MNSPSVIVTVRNLTGIRTVMEANQGNFKSFLGLVLNFLARRRGQTADVRFTPKSGHVQRTSRCPLWANSGHLVT